MDAVSTGSENDVVLGPHVEEHSEQAREAALPAAAASDAQLAPRAPAESITALGATRQSVSDRQLQVQAFPLGAKQPIRLNNGETITLGRSPDNAVVLPGPDVAEHHARLSRNAAGEYTITDLGSHTGTFTNDVAVRHAELMQGTELRIGRHRYLTNNGVLVPHDAEHGIQIDAVHLQRSVHTGGVIGGHRKLLLNDISLSIPPGTLVGLVGGSGAGKTTLLNALSGLQPADGGEVLYNGEDLYRNADEFSQSLGYVPQDDIIHTNLPVERALYYAARMRLPSGMSRAQIQRRVHDVLDDIDMGAQAKQRIADLSGGQRKRVNIAVELLANPAIFFLDEPNSGLDPGLDLKLMQLLRRLADRGHTVVIATHETRNIDLCDYICFLAPGGKLVYFGPPEDIKKHFAKRDYAQIYNAIYAEPDNWVARFRQSPDYLKYVAAPQLQSESRAVTAAQRAHRTSQRHRRNRPVKQFMLLTMRYAELMLRDRVNLAILLLQAPIIAVLVVILAKHNVVHLVENPGLARVRQDIYAQRALFILATSAVWFGTINAAREIVKEAAIYRRERTINLHILPYALSKFVVLGVLSAIQSFVLLYIVGLQTGYPNSGVFLPGLGGAFFELYISLVLMAFSGMAMGLLISALAPNTDRAISFVPIILIPQIIFANVIFTLDGSGRYISWAISARWGMEALGSIAGLHNRFTDHLGEVFYVTDRPHVLGYWAVLAALTLFFFLVTLIVLRSKDAVTREF